MTDHIVVKLNGKEYQTEMVNGVQRFVPNPVVKKLLDKNSNVYCSLGYRKFEELGLYSLNEISLDFYQGEFTVEDMLDFYTQTGYSVSGMLDLSYFEDVEVENPLWDNEV